MAVLSVTLEQLSAVFAATSPLLESIFFAAATVGTPAILLALGANLRQRCAQGAITGKTLLFYGYTLLLSVLLSLITATLCLRGQKTTVALAEEAMLLALGLITFAALFLFIAAKAPAWLWFGLFVLVSFVPDLVKMPESFPALSSLLRGFPYVILGWELEKKDLPSVLRIKAVQIASALFLLLFGCVAIANLSFLRPLGQLFFTSFYTVTTQGGELLLLHLLQSLLTFAALFALLSLSEFLQAVFQKPKNLFGAVLFLPLLRILTYEGGYVSILRMISEAHWLILYVPLMLLLAAVLLSDTLDVFVQLLWFPLHGTMRGRQFRTALRNMTKYRFLLLELVKKGIVLKYRRSFLGILWSLVEPLLTMMVLTYVFRSFFGRNDPLYAVYILTGRLMFTLFQSTTKEALRSIRSNATMIKKVYVPKYMYPLSTILYNFVLFLISLIDLGLVMAYKKVPLTWHLVEGLVPIFVLLMFAVGIGMLLATINVFFRDIEYLWNVFLLLLMYCSAVFYQADALKNSSAGWIFKVNPVYLMIYNFRLTVMEGKGLDGDTMLLGCVFAGISLFVGFTVFYRKQDEFILHI